MCIKSLHSKFRFQFTIHSKAITTTIVILLIHAPETFRVYNIVLLYMCRVIVMFGQELMQAVP